MSSVISTLHTRLEHSALKSTTTQADIKKLCEEAIQHNLYAAVVNPIWVSVAKSCLRDSTVHLVTTCNFPLGASRGNVALSEAMKAIDEGAQEIDLVASIGRLCADEFSIVEDELTAFRSRLPSPILLKVIIETPVLTSVQIVEATKAVINSGAEFIKTGTGFSGPVTAEQVKAIAAVTNGQIKIKAAGGIRTLADCLSMIEAGADRIGTSNAPAILTQS
jgi:deoxyribose-phosphate aldolase